jgi:cytochrome c biogenesis protein CcmG/thiol:disulfide interchange protein DsbE
MTAVLETAPGKPGPPRRRRHLVRWIAGAILVVLVAVAVVAATRPSYQATQVASPLLGHSAPALHATSFTGSPVTLSQYRGRYVYVNFFASWCPPCTAEEPNLVAFNFQQQRHPGGAALLSVVFNDSDAAARRFVQQWGALWPAVSDPNGTAANAFGVESPPMTFLINPAGRIAGVWDGPVTVAQLDAMLATARRHG